MIKLKVTLKMGLLNNANSTPAFEAEDDTAVTATAAEQTTSTAVASKPVTTAIAIAKPDFSAMTVFKNAVPVEYNTLDQIIANAGNFMTREAKKPLGDTVVFELLSYQDSFVVSPEDDDAPDDLVRYSNDGEVCSDGTSVAAHLEHLRSNGYPKARLKPRVVVVGAIESFLKSEEHNGTIMQFDLSPASKVQWDRFLLNTGYGLKTGRVDASKVNRIKAEAVATTAGPNVYTLVKFKLAD